jgi:hypothetical protein
MYKNKLFAYGAKHLLRNKGSYKSYKKGKKAAASGGSLNNLDNYLLSLVGGVRRMSVSKPKKAAKSGRGSGYGGCGLKFVR